MDRKFFFFFFFMFFFFFCFAVIIPVTAFSGWQKVCDTYVYYLFVGT